MGWLGGNQAGPLGIAGVNWQPFIRRRCIHQATDANGRAHAAPAATRAINLALQGGGSHGAFTWGVLDRLLQDERVSFEGVSASSAGAVNAAVLAQGLTSGGRNEARRTLRRFWKRISEATGKGIMRPSLFDKLKGNYGLEHSPGYLFIDVLSYFSSPYLYNPYNYNPLRQVLEEVIDFERLRRESALKLFLCATNVRTGKVKVFKSAELGPDQVLASTCLPLLMHAVEIDDEVYWDGGFSGNPAIFPLIYECESRDIVMIHLTPTVRPQVPVTSHAIMNRMQEIGFNAALIREMRAVTFVTKLIDEGRLAGGKRMLVHIIEAEDVIRALPGSSRLNNDWDFLCHLHDVGRSRAELWLNENFDNLGARSTVDLEAKYF